MEIRKLAREYNRNILFRWQPKGVTFVIGNRKRNDTIVGAMHLDDEYGVEAVKKMVDRMYRKGTDKEVIKLYRGDKITLISK